jgi:hypothetical protein
VLGVCCYRRGERGVAATIFVMLLYLLCLFLEFVIGKVLLLSTLSRAAVAGSHPVCSFTDVLP